jgi:glycosyltransferase involved in cell wall biosynthesis
MTTVSVVVPVFNGEKFIEECLDSVLKYSSACDVKLEVIVFDNNSSDFTLKKLEKYDRDERVRVLRSDVTIPAADNWNRVSKLATGDFVKLLPADDTLLNNCLEHQIQAMKSNPSAVLVASSRRVITEKGFLLPKRLGKLSFEGLIGGEKILKKIVKSARGLGEPGAVLFRGEAFRQTLPWNPLRGYAIDLDFYLRVLKLGDFFGLSSPHASFRLSGKSWSNDLRKTQSTDLVNLLVFESSNLSQSKFLASKTILRFRVVALTILRRQVNFFSSLIDRLIV